MANPADISKPHFAPDFTPIFIGGPTAVGKSSFALQLAEQIGGEIISVDSMQVYRGLDIGTAKPSVAERARVPHHLIDVCELHEDFDAARFVRLAKEAVTQIQSRQHRPIFCGGTGLYFRAYLDGLGTSPATSKELRTELEQTPLEQLLNELQKADPVAFDKIDRKNPRRVIRAVEVIRLTGRPFSEQRADWKTGSAGAKPAEDAPLFIGFTRAKADLQPRIDARVDAMIAAGLVAETEALLQHGLAENKTAMQAIGYRQVVEHLRGERPLSETIDLVKARTRQYAKRQLSWFKAQRNLTWLELDERATFTNIFKQLKLP